jgi:serine/threonine-protein kinase
MYEMLCGQLPFQSRGAGYWSLARMHVMDRPTPPREIEPGVPVALETAVLRALVKEPTQRPSAAELAAELRRFLQT